jgi:hypothetical protein
MAAASVRILVATALLAVAVVPSVSLGAHGDACGRTWSQSSGIRDCGFAFTGFPVTAFATACRNPDCRTGQTSVRVWVTISTTPIVVLECSAEGVGYASCDNEVSAGTALTTFAGSVPLTCNVAGTGGGVFGCGSGCVNPNQGPVCGVLATPLPTPEA